MDSVHHPEVRSWISPKVKLKTYFDDFKLAIESNGRGELPAKKMIEDKRKFTQYHLRLLMQTPPPPLELAGKAVPGVVGGRGCQITEEMIKNIAQQCDIDSLKYVLHTYLVLTTHHILILLGIVLIVLIDLKNP